MARTPGIQHSWRTIFNTLTVLSLLLMLGVIGLWVHSYFVIYDGVTFNSLKIYHGNGLVGYVDKGSRYLTGYWNFTLIAPSTGSAWGSSPPPSLGEYPIDVEAARSKWPSFSEPPLDDR